MRVSVPALLLALSSAALAQEPPAPAPSFGVDAPRTPSAPSATTSNSVDSAGLVGLKASPGPRPVVTLDDVLARAGADAADVQIAAERIVQSEANLRRAWAAVLPSLTLSGAYTLTCTGGSDVNCADRTTQLVDPRQLDQEANLFESIASLLTIAAGAATSPDDRQKLLDQAAQLNTSAQQVKQSAQNAKPVVVQPANVFSGSLTMSLPLFNGRAFPLIQNAYSAVDVAHRAREQVKSALLYSATRAYHAAVAAKKLVAIAEQQVAIAEKHRDATRVRVEAATQPALALRRSELDALRAKSQLANATSAYDVAVAGIGLVIGRDEQFDVIAPTRVVTVPTGNPDELADRAVSTRPDVASEKLAVEIARRGELDAWMMFAPSVNLVASAHATSFTSGFVRDPVTGVLALTASVPLYDGGLRYAALKDSSSRTREESIRERQLEDRVRAQVRGNARDISQRENARELAQQSVDVATTAHDQAEASFEAGVGTSLDVSDTALAVFLAENDLARADLDLELSRIGLAYAVGAYP